MQGVRVAALSDAERNRWTELACMASMDSCDLTVRSPRMGIGNAGGGSSSGGGGGGAGGMGGSVRSMFLNDDDFTFGSTGLVVDEAGYAAVMPYGRPLDGGDGGSRSSNQELLIGGNHELELELDLELEPEMDDDTLSCRSSRDGSRSSISSSSSSSSSSKAAQDEYGTPLSPECVHTLGTDSDDDVRSVSQNSADAELVCEARPVKRIKKGTRRAGRLSKRELDKEGLATGADAKIERTGLRSLSRSLCERVAEAGTVTRHQIAMHIAKYLHQAKENRARGDTRQEPSNESQPGQSPCASGMAAEAAAESAEPTMDKSIKRRVYDFVNVLITCGVVEETQNHELRWIGPQALERLNLSFLTETDAPCLAERRASSVSPFSASPIKSRGGPAPSPCLTVQPCGSTRSRIIAELQLERNRRLASIRAKQAQLDALKRRRKIMDNLMLSHHESVVGHLQQQSPESRGSRLEMSPRQCACARTGTTKHAASASAAAAAAAPNQVWHGPVTVLGVSCDASLHFESSRTRDTLTIRVDQPDFDLIPEPSLVIRPMPREWLPE